MSEFPNDELVRGAPERRSARPGRRAQQSFDLFDPPSSRGPDTDWRSYLLVLRRRMWPALAVFIVVVVAATVNAYSRVPVYQARGRLILETDLAELAGIRDPIAQNRVMNTLQMQAVILQSRSLARRTLQALGAWPTGAPAAAAPEQSGLGVTVPTAGETPAEAALIDGFLAGLRVPSPLSGNLIEVTYTSVDSVTAARNVNTLLEQFIQQNLERKFLASKQLTDWLSGRLADQRKALEQSERELQRYRESQGATAAPQRADALVQRVMEISEAYTRAKADRIAKEALMTQIEGGLKDGADFENFPALPGYPSLIQAQQDLSSAQRQQAQLSQKLGEKHPDLIAARHATSAAIDRLRREVKRVVDLIRAEYTAARSTEQKLASVMESHRAESITLNRADVQLAVLERDAESNREIYESLLQRVNEYDVTRGQPISNIRVLDAAEIPRAPLNTAAQRDLRYGFLGGLLLAVGLAFLLEHLDNAVKTPEQITALGLPFLGIVPMVRNEDQADRTSPLIHQQSAPAFSEAIRGVRTNVRLSIASDGARSVVVTSTNAGEGKTVMASNLATALALSGQRVMLIDADLRRPKLHKVFSTDQAPGLTNLLIGEAKAADIVHRAAVPNLHVLSSGSLPPNPSELLDSKRFRDFLVQLGKYYDWIILDAPPVMPVTDAVILGDIVDGVLMVVAAEVTPLPLLRSAVEQMERTTAIKLGAVLNKVNLEGRPYYYSRYYRPDYKSYYVGSTTA